MLPTYRRNDTSQRRPREIIIDTQNQDRLTITNEPSKRRVVEEKRAHFSTRLPNNHHNLKKNLTAQKRQLDRDQGQSKKS